jgi:hypothetical protein
MGGGAVRGSAWDRAGTSWRFVALAIAGLAVGLSASASRAAQQTIYYGGGTILSPQHEQLVSLAKTSPHRLVFWSSLADNDHPSQCGAVSTPKTHVTVHADGSFSASGPTSGQPGQFTMSGRFTRPGEAAGTARAKYTTGSASCDSGKSRWRVYAPSLGLGSGLLARDAFYGGVTSQTSKQLPSVHQPVLFKVNHDESKVIEITVTMTMVCKSGSDRYTDHDFFDLNLPIQHGKFHHNGHGSQALNASETAHFNSSLSGRFKRHRVLGAWKVSAVVRKNADGSVVDTCGGDTKHWQAARRAP